MTISKQSKALLPEVDAGLQFDTLTTSKYETVTGVNMSVVQDQVLLNIARLVPEGVDGLDWAVQQMSVFNPQDAVESMLAQQMIALNTMLMKCNNLDLVDGQTNAGWEMHLKHIANLSTSFSNIVAALDKHRGKGKQTIVVKHQQVNVADGGQAVIGDVKHGGNGK